MKMQFFSVMETTLNYKFKRQFKNHLDWLVNIIKSEKYYQFEGRIVSFQNNVLIDNKFTLFNPYPHRIFKNAMRIFF